MSGSAPSAPYYRAVFQEVSVFEHAYGNRLPLLIKGPTGCGKSRFVEHMAHRLGRPLITVACHEDTAAADLLGRYLVQGGDTVWQDGPVTRAVRRGAVLYLDEIAEARQDVIAVLHPLSDHRRQLFLDRRDETLTAPAEFMLVASYNPGYQQRLKDLKPSLRQRFLGLSLGYPEKSIETEIIARESGVDASIAAKLVALAHKLRNLQELGMTEVVSTRLLVSTARLIHAGLGPRLACDVGVIQPLSDDAEVVTALRELAALHF